MSKFAGAKSFQKWGFWLLACSFLLFVAGIMLVALAFSSGEEYAKKGYGGQAFDESKLSLYEDKSKPPVGIKDLLGNEAKQYAIDVLKIPESEMANPGEAEMAKMIRAEVAKQWNKLSEEQKGGCSQLDAERSILTYAFGEQDGLGHFETNGTPHCENNCGSAGRCRSGSVGTLQPLSVTCDKYFGSYNQQVAAFWDQKYTIYLGVREHIGVYLGVKNAKDCQDRWGITRKRVSVTHWAWPPGSGYPYGGGRYERAVKKAEQYTQ